MWTPPEGGGSRFVFTGRGGGANPVGWGERVGVTPPHYPWLVAVSRMGGLLMTGIGECRSTAQSGSVSQHSIHGMLTEGTGMANLTVGEVP